MIRARNFMAMIPDYLAAALKCLRLEAPDKVCQDIEDKVLRALQVSDAPVAGGQYVHNKTGNHYTVLAVGIYCGKHTKCGMDHERYGPGAESTGFPEGTEMVVYVGHYMNPRGNKIYIRPHSEWNEGVDVTTGEEKAGGAPRYERLL